MEEAWQYSVVSRAAYSQPRDARKNWPLLADFLPLVVHGDDARTVQNDVNDALDKLSLPERQALATEWWSWNATAGASDDVRFTVEAFDSGMAFDTADHARAFMNEVYDRLVVSIRRDVGKDWKR